MVEQRVSWDEERASQQRVLIVGKGIGSLRIRSDYPMLHQTHRLIIEQFKTAGFSIENADNQQEIPQGVLCFGLHSRDFSSPHERYKFIAQEAGVTMPQEYHTVRDILDCSGPILVKPNGVHRGEGKVLVESAEDKEKLITIALSQAALEEVLNTPGGIFSSHKKQKLVYKILQQNLSVAKKILSGDISLQQDLELMERKLPKTLIAQEYIDTPGEYPSSFRVVVVGNKIIYGALMVNPERKISYVDDRNARRRNNEISLASTEEIYTLLSDPNSPTYIPKREVISNPKDAIKIVLNKNLTCTRKTQDIINAKGININDILSANGVDPSNAQVPEVLQTMCQALGEASQLDYPIIGLDIITRKREDGSLEHILLEANVNPHIEGFEIGMPVGSDTLSCYRYILQANL